jgi:hypothetical protein
MNKQYSPIKITRLLTVAIVAILAIIIGAMVLIPQYNVYSRQMSGKAQLAEAEYNRRIAVQEAQAKKDSATLLADAEILRAGGVAEANRIIGQSLKNNSEYLWYLWIDGLANSANQTIYIPTEANLPILEASRLGNK